MARTENSPELAKRFAILENAVENTNEAFVTIDEESRVILFNKAAEHLFGYGRDEVIGRDLAEILSPMCRDGHQEAVARYVHTGQGRLIGHETEVRITRRGGEVVPASLSFSVARVDGHYYFTGLLRDLSETKRLQEQLVQKERLAVLGQTVAEINHEIKNPLVMIGGFARQLLRKAKDGQDRDKLSVIVGEVERLEHLLFNLRELYRMPQLHLAEVGLNRLLAEIVALAGPQASGAGVALRFEPDREVRVAIDQEKMRQVLLNLIKNAIEATPAGGSVVVSTRMRPGMVEVVVADTGRGIPESIKKRVFLPFFTTKEQGTGLGLCVSKRIVDDHPGCSFRIDSEEGKGTVAVIGICLNGQGG
ncbi:MAG: two-component system sensor histidine kinase NtrB [Thermodesulfobacteriota bacterium]